MWEEEEDGCPMSTPGPKRHENLSGLLRRTIAAKITIVAKTTDRGAKAKEPGGDKSGIVEVHVVVGGDIVIQQWSRGCVRTWYNSFT